MAGVTFPKVCILLLYVRLLELVKYRTRMAVYWVLGTVVANYLVIGVAVLAAQCTPYAFHWDKSIPGGRCLNIQAISVFASVSNILTDLAVLALPFFTFGSLKMSRMQKAGLLATFLTGGLRIITSILRFVAFFQVNVYENITFFSVKPWIFLWLNPVVTSFVPACLAFDRF